MRDNDSAHTRRCVWASPGLRPYRCRVLDRRRFLTVIAAGVAVAAEAFASPPTALAEPGAGRVPLPGGAALSSLPATHAKAPTMALTVDDGVSSEVVRAYTTFARDSGIRLTYFVNGVYGSWTENAALLKPLVDSGQIQLGNHTYTHPDLTKLTEEKIIDELTRNGQFLKNTYGVDPAPYFRPPYGRHNAVTDAVAEKVGYSCPVLWNGSLSDSTVVTPDYIVDMAHKYFNPGAIVIGHLNHSPVTTVYAQLIDVIKERGLQTVTLNDVFSSGDRPR